MAAQRGFALGVRARLSAHQGTSCSTSMSGDDALGLDRFARRREVTRGGEAQRAVAAAERMMVCTEPLPNERVPTSVARLWSWSAPATISTPRPSRH